MNIKERLIYLKNRNEELKSIVFVGFKTETELLAHREKVKTERNEYYSNIEEINQLELKLMSSQEKELLNEQQLISKLVREGKYFDYMINQKENKKNNK